MQLTGALLASLLAATSMATAPLPYFKHPGSSVSHSYKHHTPGATPSFKHHSPSRHPHHHTPSASPVIPDPIMSLLPELPIDALEKRDQWRHGHSASPSWKSPSHATPTGHPHHTSKKHHTSSKKHHHTPGSAHPTGRVVKRDAEWKHHPKSWPSGAAQPTGHHHRSSHSKHPAPTEAGFGAMFKRNAPFDWSKHHSPGSWPSGAPKPTGKPHHHHHHSKDSTKTGDWQSTAYWNQPEPSPTFNRSWGRPAPPSSTSLSFKTAVKKHHYPSGTPEATGHHHHHHHHTPTPTGHHHHTPSPKPTGWWWW